LQIANVTFPPLGLPDWWQRVLIIALAVGVVPAFILAWVFDLTGRGIVRTSTATADAAARNAHAGNAGALVPAAPTDTSPATDASCDAAACATANATSSAADASIAILPFTDLSAAKDQDWFCDGLAEEIIDALCCVR